MNVAKRLLARRLELVGVIVLGTVYAIAADAGGHLVSGLLGAACIVVFGVLLTASGPAEAWQLARREGDERLRHIQAESARIVLGLVTLVVVGGAMWELAHGYYYGPYGVMASVIGGLTLIVPQILRQRR